MLERLGHTYLIVALITCATIETYAQTRNGKLTGIVYDSLTRLPLSYVTVYNVTARTGGTTTENGSFTINGNPGDSILFTILGYSRRKRVVGSNELAMIVFLREFALTLNPVTIYGGYTPHGADKWKSAVEMPKTFRNPAGPGSGYAIETFGPGFSVMGLLSKMSRSEKEKKKLGSIREKAKKSETYLSVIMSEETKAFFQRTFTVSESEYEKFIESFNTVHPEAVYIQSKEDILNLMVVFMATKK